MKILLDENLPHKLRTQLAGHDVSTVAYMKWIGIRNGDLLDRAENAGFDVLITSDQGFPHQQNMAGRSLAVIVLSTPDWNVLRHHVAKVAAAIEMVKPGSFTRVEVRSFARSRQKPPELAP